MPWNSTDDPLGELLRSQYSITNIGPTNGFQSGFEQAIATYDPSMKFSWYDNFSQWSNTEEGLNTLSMVSTAAGMVGGAISGYYASNIRKIQAQMQAQVAEFNQRQAERSAQAALMQSNARISQISRQYERVKSSQKASMAANGVVLGVGSAAEVTASTDIDKQISINNEYMNGYYAAWGYRMQGVSQGLQASAANAYRSSGPGSMIEGATSGVNKGVRDYLFRRRNDNYGVI